MSDYVVALIGGVGAGKSTVLDIFASFGVKTLSADKIARALVAPNTPALKAIINHFGKKILNRDNTLNRRALRSLIFDSPEDKKWLENLLHPEIRRTLEKRVEAADTDYCVVEIPLLTSKAGYPYIDRILLVKADNDSRIQRVSQRDNTSYEAVKQIIETQMDDVDREAMADDILENNKDFHAIKAACKSLHQTYLSNASGH